MKILFFCIRFPLASETFVLNQVIYFIKKGYDVKVLSLYPGDTEKVHGDFEKYNIGALIENIFDADEIPGNKLSLIFSRAKIVLKSSSFSIIKAFNFERFKFLSYSLLLPAIFAKLRNNKISADVIIAHFGHCGVLANAIRNIGLINGKLLTVFHGYDISTISLLKKYKILYKNLFSQGEYFLPISNLWRDKLISMGCDKDKISVIRMGIKIDEFKYEFHARDQSTLNIISVCRLTEKKGLVYAIDACNALKNKGCKFKYKIIGYGELENVLAEKIKALGLQDYVYLLGFQPQSVVKTALAESNVFLLPSVTASNGDMEGIPVALMEAMASGLPVISTYHSGIPELIDDHKNGYLCPERNSEAIAKILYEIYEGKDNLSLIASEARDKIYSQFNEEVEFNKIVTLLESIK
ncbi:glycosyltransferase [Klebsiella pneumoniae]